MTAMTVVVMMIITVVRLRRIIEFGTELKPPHFEFLLSWANYLP